MKKFLSLFMVSIMTLVSVISSTNITYADELPNIVAKHAVVMDYETKQILYEKDANSKIYPASTTKAWTAYLVLKHVKNLNEVVEIKDLPPISGSSMYLRNGESFTVKQLLDALLVHSCNDVAFVLGRYVGNGDIQKFIDLMNSEAKAIGATGTHFNNPHGLPDSNHYTTAHDMALMSRVAMGNDIFRSIVKTKSLKYPATKAYPYERYFVNTNKLLTSNDMMNYKGKSIPVKYDIVDGIKTGYTDAAGKCLLSSGVKDGRRIIVATFNSTNDALYPDSRTLLDYGFDNFTSYTVLNKDKYTSTKKVFLTKEKELVYAPEYTYKVVLPNGQSKPEYTTKTKLEDIKFPVHKGDKVGTLSLYDSEEKLVQDINLVAQRDLNSAFSFITSPTQSMILVAIVSIAIIAVILFIIAMIHSSKKKKKKKKNMFSSKAK